jgi:Uncharacterized MobA-related protein
VTFKNADAHKNIAAVILAAGASVRFGQPKQLLDWGGVPLIAHVADVALAAGFARVVVVLGYQLKRSVLRWVRVLSRRDELAVGERVEHVGADRTGCPLA